MDQETCRTVSVSPIQNVQTNKQTKIYVRCVFAFGRPKFAGIVKQAWRQEGHPASRSNTLNINDDGEMCLNINGYINIRIIIPSTSPI